MSKTRVIVYCRLGHEDKQAIQGQTVLLREYAKSNDYEITRVMTEIGQASTLQRPVLSEALEYAYMGAADALLVKNGSRITRNKMLLLKFVNQLHAHNVELVCMEGGRIDFSEELKKFGVS